MEITFNKENALAKMITFHKKKKEETERI